MLARYGGMYTAAAMELYNKFLQPEQSSPAPPGVSERRKLNRQF